MAELVAVIASTIPLWAPQRQRLPLMRSRSSSRLSAMSEAARSSVTWLGTPRASSAAMAIAEQSCPGVQ